MPIMIYTDTTTGALTAQIFSGDPLDAIEQCDVDVWHEGIEAFGTDGELLASLPSNLPATR